MSVLEGMREEFSERPERNLEELAFGWQAELENCGLSHVTRGHRLLLDSSLFLPRCIELPISSLSSSHLYAPWQRAKCTWYLCLAQEGQIDFILCIKSDYSESRVFRATHFNPLVGSDVDSGSRADGSLPCIFFLLYVRYLFIHYSLDIYWAPSVCQVLCQVLNKCWLNKCWMVKDSNIFYKEWKRTSRWVSRLGGYSWG